MQRRDFIKAMMAASATATAATTAVGQQAAPAKPPTPAMPAPGPVPWTRGLAAAKPLPMMSLVPDAVAQTDVHFFSAQQMATLRRFSEILMPALKGNPSAIEAGTPEFIDFLIGVSPSDRQQMYLNGLDRLESEAKQHYGKPFATIEAAQADKLLRPWLRAWMSDHPPTDPHAHFINIAHSDIRTATMNSQAWSDAAIAAGRKGPDSDLYWYPIDPNLRRDKPAIPSRPIRAKQHS